MATACASTDPITDEIIQSSICAIADEMFLAMAKTAMSSVIYEVLDFGVVITTADGALASSGAGIPSFIGMLAPGVQAIIGKFHAANEIRPGDIFISNDPFSGGVSHLNDIALMMPVFDGDVLVAWTANKGHWVDVGGKSPGSITADATEIFQEGLILPDIRLFDQGRPVQAVLDIIAANGRMPRHAMGDLWAGIAAMRVGARRILELCRKYGRETFLGAMDRYLDWGEEVSLRALRDIPKGEFSVRDSLDDGTATRATVTITDREFLVDLSGNPAALSYPMNASYAATMISAQIIFKGITSPETRANAGSFRPLKLLTDPGSMFDAQRPAPVGLYYENKLVSADLIWKALAPHMPDRLTAGHFCSICATMISRRDARTNQLHSFIEPLQGGWGAGRGKDGENALFCASHGETFNCPVEVNEARNGIFVDRLTFNPDAGGEGEFRGGKGVLLEYRILDEASWVTASYNRSVVPPWGMNGGRAGSLNKLTIRRQDGREESPGPVTRLALSKGDVLRITTANGGGFGNPARRPRAKIAADLRDGYITPSQAHEYYGWLESPHV